jgi:hypothetical protein
MYLHNTQPKNKPGGPTHASHTRRSKYAERVVQTNKRRPRVQTRKNPSSVRHICAKNPSNNTYALLVPTCVQNTQS